MTSALWRLWTPRSHVARLSATRLWLYKLLQKWRLDFSFSSWDCFSKFRFLFKLLQNKVKFVCIEVWKWRSFRKPAEVMKWDVSFLTYFWYKTFIWVFFLLKLTLFWGHAVTEHSEKMFEMKNILRCGISHRGWTSTGFQSLPSSHSNVIMIGKKKQQLWFGCLQNSKLLAVHLFLFRKWLWCLARSKTGA